jgi:hypothetical protein
MLLKAWVSLATWWGAVSRFVQVTVVPAGTVTEAGLKTKFWMVTATAGRVVGVAGAAVVVITGRVVSWVVTGAALVVTTGAVVGGRVVAVGAVVITGVAWVVTGAVPGVEVQPAARAARNIITPMIAMR